MLPIFLLPIFLLLFTFVDLLLEDNFREEDDDGLLLAAAFHGDHLPLSDAVLFKMALKFPLMTLKVMAGIHIEAVRLWLIKAPYFPHKSGENVEKKRLA